MRNRTTALVLSGGGMFGAWQAGVWRALSSRFQPDLVVGASVGSLNGWTIAANAPADELIDWWLRPGLAIRNLREVTQSLVDRYQPKTRYGVVLTDVLRLKPQVFPGQEVTWRHLTASCALPGLVRAQKIGTRWYADGGLLDVLPVAAAVELGASRIIGIHALPQLPSRWLNLIAKAFSRVAGRRAPLPDHIELTVITPEATLGSVHDSLHWKRGKIERWIDQGYECGARLKLLSHE
jgi:NTE family protein